MNTKTFTFGAAIATLLLASTAASAARYDVVDELASGGCPSGFSLFSLSDFTAASQTKLAKLDANSTEKLCMRKVAGGATNTGTGTGAGIGGAATGLTVAALGTLMVLTLTNNANNTTSTPQTPVN